MSNDPSVTIAGRHIAVDRSPAEMLTTHDRSIGNAYKIIEAAKHSGADFASTRTNYSLELWSFDPPGNLPVGQRLS